MAKIHINISCELKKELFLPHKAKPRGGLIRATVTASEGSAVGRPVVMNGGLD